MVVVDLTFTDQGTGLVIHDPYDLGSAASMVKTITVTNSGTNDLENLGLYIRPSATLGDLDLPSDNSPETDYQDLLPA